MNGRILRNPTPGGRIAAAARSLAVRMKKEFPLRHGEANEPDYADFEEALTPMVDRELIIARLDEIRRSKLFNSQRRIERERELVAEFVKIDLVVEEWANQ